MPQLPNRCVLLFDMKSIILIHFLALNLIVYFLVKLLNTYFGVKEMNLSPSECFSAALKEFLSLYFLFNKEKQD